MQLCVPIKWDLSNVVIDILKKVDTEEKDCMYQKGFYDARDAMIKALEYFCEEHYN